MIMAVFAEVNGNPITPILRQRLALLADNVLSGISNPETFVTLTGTEQHQEGLRTSYALAWLEPYAVLFAPSDQADILLSELHPMRATRLGGNLSDLFRPQANKYQTN